MRFDERCQWLHNYMIISILQTYPFLCDDRESFHCPGPPAYLSPSPSLPSTLLQTPPTLDRHQLEEPQGFPELRDITLPSEPPANISLSGTYVPEFYEITSSQLMAQKWDQPTGRDGISQSHGDVHIFCAVGVLQCNFLEAKSTLLYYTMTQWRPTSPGRKLKLKFKNDSLYISCTSLHRLHYSLVG